MSRLPLETWSRSRGMRLDQEAYSTGHPAHIVLRTLGRRPVIADLHLEAAVFGYAAGFPETMGVCVMPDHVHWLVGTDGDFSSIIGRFKSQTTRMAWARGWHGRIWQRSYFDRVIRDHRELSAVVRCILGNPTRAGLVVREAEYPFVAGPDDLERWDPGTKTAGTGPAATVGEGVAVV